MRDDNHYCQGFVKRIYSKNAIDGYWNLFNFIMCKKIDSNKRSVVSERNINAKYCIILVLMISAKTRKRNYTAVNPSFDLISIFNV